VADPAKVPVFVLSGFLGSGKTTLLNRLLKDPAFANTAVVVNEFGEIGLDHLLIAQGSDNVVLLDSGCLCCTISDSLHETLADLNFRKVRGEVPAFEHVIIETTGLADPAPILNTLLGHRLVTDLYQLEAAIVTVDAQHALASLDTAPEVAKQIAVADRLVVTKLDLAPMADALAARLDALNPDAPRLDVRAPGALAEAFAAGQRHFLPRRFVAIARAGAASIGRSHLDDPARGIRADCYVLAQPPTWAGIAAWWRVASMAFGDRLLRCKGVIEIAGTGEIVFLQGVQRVFHSPERLAGWPDADHRSRLVCITRDVAAADLRQTLQALGAAAGTPAELELTDLSMERNLQ
jgi:G3E family GTPase